MQTVFDLSVGSFWEVSMKKIRYILSFLHTEQNLFGIQSENFQQGRQKELSKLSIISGHWAKSFRPFVKKILQGYQNCILRVYRNSLNEKASQKKVLGFLLFLEDWAEKLWLFINFFWWSCQKCNLRVHRNFSPKIFFEKFYLGFQFFFGFWPEKVSAFRHTFLGRFEKTAFYVSINIFWGEFSEKNVSLSFWTTSTNSVVRTVFYVSRGNF